ncbi:MAG: SpoIIE family protein phosphatase [bacterium]
MLRKVEKEQLKVPANVDYLGDLRDFVSQVGKKHRFPDKVINAFKLAIDEAATNIIRHAYRDQQGLITLRTIVRKNSLTICIVDQGTYFDPKRVKDPDLNRYIAIGKKGGLGIFIMRKLMDEIDYRRTEEGNELRITKYRDKKESKDQDDKVSSIPFTIKASFFLRSIAIVTAFIAVGYLYYYSTADDIVFTNFITTERTKSSQIVKRITKSMNSASEEDLSFIFDIVNPIYEDNKDQIHGMSIEDSTGLIAYTPKIMEEFGRQFRRPSDSEKIERGLYKYFLNETPVYEFENRIVLESTGTVFGKSHIVVSAEEPIQEIQAIRVKDLKLAILILGATYLGVAILIYLVMNPLRKLSSWIKDLGHGGIDDEIDIDASSEIGEIAQAFSDITHKFRESQKSLVDQERIQKEMQVAQEIQQTLLPMEFPEIEGYEIASYYEAAKEVGGDYYDFVEVDKDTLGIAIADVSGKGVPGSLVMTMIRTALRTEARGEKDAAEVLARVNAFVKNDIKKGMFVTVFYLIIDSKNRRLNYASAGHNPMILYRGSKKNTYYLNPKGFPIGIQLPEKDLFRRSIISETIQLTKDDILLIYTDGITEAMNPSRDLFGEERLLKVLRDFGNLPADDFVEKLKISIDSFTRGTPQYDDISFVAIKEKSTKEEDELRRAKEVQQLISSGMSIREACETVNLTTYAYYNKYKRIFEEEGIDAFEIDEDVSVEAKYLSIEEKTKIFDIIANHPEFGASRISTELNTEKYSFTKISESKIYDELVRNRLNTRPLRESFVDRGKRNKRRLKPPGTPMLTLDGQLIIERKDEIDYSLDKRPVKETPPAESRPADLHEAIPETDREPEVVSVFDSYDADSSESVDELTPAPFDETDIEADSLIDEPIDEVLSKESQEQDAGFDAVFPEENSTDFDDLTDLQNIGADQEQAFDEILDNDSAMNGSEPDQTDLHFKNLTGMDKEIEQTEDFSFEDLFEATTDLRNDDFEDEFLEQEEVESFDSLGEYEGTLLDVNEEPESNLNSEVFEVDPSAKKSGEDFHAASIDELLSDETESLSFGEETGINVEDASKKVNESVSEPPGEDQNSFADLIQAIDDEIVYVTDNLDENQSTNHTESKPSGSGAYPETESRVIEKQADPNGAKQESQISRSDLDDREKQLIKGIRYYKGRNYNEAIREFKEVIARYPDYKEAHSILGNAYFRNKMYDDASIAYSRVKELDANDITAYENMGVIYANRGQYRLAVSEWKNVLELCPDRTDIEDKIKKALLMI